MKELEKQLQQQAEEIARLREENRLLREKVDLLVRKLFGKSSEALDSAQLELLLEGEDGPGKPEESAGSDLAPADAESTQRGTARQGRKPRLPEDLPVEETVLFPEPVKACPEAYKRIGEEISEQLDYRPGRFVRLRTIRPKFIKRSDKAAAPIIAGLPPKLIEGGLPAAGLLAHITISKYADHLPLYRQQQIFKQRHRVELPRQTLARWIEATADWLKPVAEEIRSELLANNYLQVDETPIRYLAPGNGQTKQGYLWTYRIPGGNTYFDWHGGRSHHCLKNVIPHDFIGIIQSDGYRAYRTFADKHPAPLHLAACWAHVRRKFHDALQAGESPARSAWLLRHIQHLYRIERHLRESRAGPRLRQAVRASHSRPVIDRIGQALVKLKASHRHLPKSLLGQAIDYALGQWPGLGVYLEHGQVEIDNNLVENAIRPTKLGAKNWLFIGAKEAGWRSAVIYTVIESCRNHRLDPHAYLSEVLTRLPVMTNRQIKDITPKAIAARNRGKSRDKQVS